MSKSNIKKIIKSTKYCDILKQTSLMDEEYMYCIEKIFVKSRKREEIRFAVYKDTIRGDGIYIPKSLDVTELELIEIIRKSLKENIFSKEFIEILKQELYKLYMKIYNTRSFYT